MPWVWLILMTGIYLQEKRWGDTAEAARLRRAQERDRKIVGGFNEEGLKPIWRWFFCLR